MLPDDPSRRSQGRVRRDDLRVAAWTLPDPTDRKLSKSTVNCVMQTEVAKTERKMRAAQRQTELPGMVLDRGSTIERVSPERSRGPDLSR